MFVGALIVGFVLAPEANSVKSSPRVQQKAMQGNSIEMKSLRQLADAKREKGRLEKKLKELQDQHHKMERERESAQLKQLKGELVTKKKKWEEELLKGKNEVVQLKKSIQELQKRGIALETENDHLRRLNISLEEVRKNGAQLYEELGTLYTRSKLFNPAIEAYQQSLTYHDSNPTVHYYLGLLYEHSHKDAQKAQQHLQEYLRLKPTAENKEEVQYLIEMLGEEKNKNDGH
jgi:tetratricopeptide (TPR) repeat protein